MPEISPVTTVPVPSLAPTARVVRRLFNEIEQIALDEVTQFGVRGHDAECRCDNCRAYIQYLVWH